METNKYILNLYKNKEEINEKVFYYSTKDSLREKLNSEEKPEENEIEIILKIDFPWKEEYNNLVKDYGFSIFNKKPTKYFSQLKEYYTLRVSQFFMNRFDWQDEFYDNLSNKIVENNETMIWENYYSEETMKIEKETLKEINEIYKRMEKISEEKSEFNLDDLVPDINLLVEEGEVRLDWIDNYFLDVFCIGPRKELRKENEEFNQLVMEYEEILYQLILNLYSDEIDDEKIIFEMKILFGLI